MYWFSSERSKRYVDKAVKRLYSFQKVFAVFALVILLTGTFLSPILYAIKNDEIIEELIDNNDLEEQENIEYFDMELSEIPIEAEVVDLRSPNEKVFKKIDGSYEIAMYSDVVHYLNEEGKFTDIDNTIIEQNNEYINKDNLFNISFPKTLNANKEVKLVIDDYEINWRLNNSITSKAVRRNGTINETDKQDLIKTTSSVIYKNALPNVDVEYVLTGSKIKENIYINKYNKNLNLVFDYNVKNLDLIKTKLGELVFINDENEIIFSVDKLFMIDNDGNVSNDIELIYSLRGEGTYTIEIKPDEEWLKKAAYPVMIDPTVTVPRVGATLEDAQVYEGNKTRNYSGNATMRVGGSSGREYRSLVRFDIPAMLNEQVITYAHLELTRLDTGTANLQANIYKNTSDFNMSTVNWNTKPLYDDSVVDYYAFYNLYTRMIFDVTKTVKEWQSGDSTNYGFTIAADSLTGLYKDVYQFDTSISPDRPTVRIGFEEPSGLKNYWTYTSQDLGDLGTGYVSDYTGNLTFVRDEYQLDSEFMSLGLSFYFNNATRSIDVGYGYGWKTNYNMRIRYDSNTSKYFLEKPDGNKIYFQRTYSSVEDNYDWLSAIAEDGSRMTLDMEFVDGGYSYTRIKTTDHLLYDFDSSGRLYQIKNTKTQHSINIYYVSDDRISYVKDMVGNRIDFTYNSSNLLSKTELKLKQPDSVNYNVIEYKSYNYSSRTISSIIQYYNYSGKQSPSFSSGDILYYSFNSITKRLNYAYNGTSRHRINYTYTTDSRVSTILVTDITTSTSYLDKLTISYGNGQTTYTNYNGEWISYLFDNYGHTINVLDSFGNAAYYKYSTLFSYHNPNASQNGGEVIDGEPNYYTVHKLIESSDMMRQKHNHIVNHGFENANGLSPWTKSSGNAGTISQSSLEKNLGEYSLEVNNITGVTSAYQLIFLRPGTYQLTGWVKNTGSIGNARIDASTSYKTNTQTINTVGKWEHFTINFEVTIEDYIEIRLYNYQLNSKAYFDNIQLVEGFTDTRYNALTNHSFENGLSNWTNFGASIISNGTTGKMNEILGDKSLQIIGNAADDKKVRQNISDFVTEGETYIIGGWAKANASPKKILSGRTNNRYFGIEVHIEVENYDEYPNEGDIITYYLPFNTATEEWQYQMTSFTVPHNTMSISIDLRYFGEGKAWFDNIQLYHDKLSTEYRYDSNNGNLISKENSNGLATTYQYDNNYNLTKIKEGNKIIDVDYNFNYLVTEFSANNVRTSFVYNYSTKQITETIMGEQSTNGEWFKSSFTYSSDNQYIIGVTDEFGQTTTTDVNHLTGLVTLIEDANANTKEYEYNNYGNLVNQIETDATNDYTIVKNINYDNNRRVASISIDGVTYGFTYDKFDRITKIKIGGIDYVTLSYLTERGTDGYTYYTDKVGTQTYSTGDAYTFTYNDENQIKSIQLNGNTMFEYVYDQAGRLTIYKDILNSQIYFYSYDLAGRIKQVTDQNGNTINYTYDSEGNINNYSYDIYDKERLVYYYYNQNTGEYDYTYYHTGDETVYKNYNIKTDDSLKRLDNIELVIGSSLSFSQHYNYKTPQSGRGNASLSVGSVNYKKNGTIKETHTFTYDNLGNITAIIVTGSLNEEYYYYYDGFNRLIREDIKIAGTAKTYVYEYDDYGDSRIDDNRGNITSIRSYNYGITTGTAQTETKLNYESSIWKDQLTSTLYYVNGNLDKQVNYTYDEIGNLVSISSNNDDEILTWEGRRLVEHETIDGKTYYYKYNDEGIRISKSNGITLTEYFVDGYNVLAEKTGNNVIYYTYDIDGLIMSMNYQNNEYFYIKNLQGDITAIVDTTGNSVAKYRYDAWGNIIYQYDDGSNISNINPYRYRGYRYDSDTGLYYLNARYYDSSIARFISADSVNYLDPSSEAGLNLYAYAGNNPVMYIDPSGNFPILFTMIIIGALIGGISGGITASENGSDIVTGILTGVLIGAAVGAVAGITLAGGGTGYLMGGLSSVGNKLISDTASSIFYGTYNFGSWEDYAVAFVIGGLIKGKEVKGTLKFAFDALVRPGLNQVVKIGTRGAKFNGQKLAYDIVTRALTNKIGDNKQFLGLELNPSKAAIRGFLSGMGKIIYG